MHSLGSRSIRATGREKKVPDDANCVHLQLQCMFDCVWASGHGLSVLRLREFRDCRLLLGAARLHGPCHGFGIRLGSLRSAGFGGLGLGGFRGKRAYLQVHG